MGDDRTHEFSREPNCFPVSFGEVVSFDEGVAEVIHCRVGHPGCGLYWKIWKAYYMIVLVQIVDMKKDRLIRTSQYERSTGERRRKGHGSAL